MAKTLLFAYGMLQHHIQPPSSMEAWSRDAVRGMMFCRDEYDVAMTKVGVRGEEWCWGDLLTIDESELPSLDESEVGYARIKVKTRHGYQAWIYAYQSAPPAGAQRILRWERAT